MFAVFPVVQVSVFRLPMPVITSPLPFSSALFFTGAGDGYGYGPFCGPE
jgi:hypothetical protein